MTRWSQPEPTDSLITQRYASSHSRIEQKQTVPQTKVVSKSASYEKPFLVFIHPTPTANAGRCSALVFSPFTAYHFCHPDIGSRRRLPGIPHPRRRISSHRFSAHC